MLQAKVDRSDVRSGSASFVLRTAFAIFGVHFSRGRCLCCLRLCDLYRLSVPRCGWHACATDTMLCHLRVTLDNRHHLNCWRVPEKVHLGLPDPDECTDPATFEAALMGMNEVLLSGLSELSADKKNELVRFAMVKNNWAGHSKQVSQKESKRKRSEEDDEGDRLSPLFSCAPLPSLNSSPSPSPSSPYLFLSLSFSPSLSVSPSL